MAGAEYQANPAGIAAMLRAPFMVEALRARAEEGKRRAEAIAPVRTGKYKASFVVEAGIRAGKAYARLSNGVRARPTPSYPDGYMYSWALEFGNSRMRRQRIIGRAIDSMRL